MPFQNFQATEFSWQASDCRAPEVFSLPAGIYTFGDTAQRLRRYRMQPIKRIPVGSKQPKAAVSFRKAAVTTKNKRKEP